jgi:hypothetical protein
MSIEKDLTRIAVALEALVQLAANPLRSVEATPVAQAPVVTAPVQTTVAAAPVVQAAPVTAPVVTTPPVQAPIVQAPVATPMKAEELNAALVAEFTRLGNNRAPIDEEMAKLGVTSVGQLTTLEQQHALLNAVKARTV